MILGTLQNTTPYNKLHPDFEKVFNFVKNTDWSKEEFGKIHLDGDQVFVIHSLVDAVEKQVLEYHKKYIDIHFLISGSETIGWKNTSDCQKIKQNFNDDDDFGLFEDEPTKYIKLKPNDFAIVFPEDAHAPIIGSGKIHKIIAKIQVK